MARHRPSEPRPPPLAQLLGALIADLTGELLLRLRAAGFGDIRPAHNAVFAHVPPEGIRLTDLAERAEMTKQAMAELVRNLEQLGYLQRRADEMDGRAKLIEFTDRGWAAVEAGLTAFDTIETQLAERIGEQRLRTFRRTLELLNS